MVVLRTGRFLCRGRGCRSIYDAREVRPRERRPWAVRSL